MASQQGETAACAMRRPGEGGRQAGRPAGTAKGSGHKRWASAAGVCVPGRHARTAAAVDPEAQAQRGLRFSSDHARHARRKTHP